MHALATGMPAAARELQYWIGLWGDLIPDGFIVNRFQSSGPEWMWEHRGLLQSQAEYIASL